MTRGEIGLRHPVRIHPKGFAEYFSADLAEKVSRGMTENALKCKFNGGDGPKMCELQHRFVWCTILSWREIVCRILYVK